MELMQLEMFVAMVEEHNFHRAARRVLRTQPAVSMALRKLEQELGIQLFDRSNRAGCELTGSGELLYGYAKRLLNLRDESIRALGEHVDMRGGCVRIGANDATSLYLLPRIILAFRAQHPNIRIQTFCQLSKRLPRDLREGNLDFAILPFNPGDSDLEARVIVRDELVLIVSPRHRLAGQGRAHLNDLGAESFIMHNVSFPARAKVIEAFHSSKTPLNCVMEIANIETIKSFVSMNIGVSFVPLMCARAELARGELVVVPVEGLVHERALWLARRRTDAHSPAAQAFIQLIESLGEKLLNGAQPPTLSKSKDLLRL